MALTLEEFLPKARQLNPDYTDDELIQAYQDRYRKPPTQTVSPAPLMTLEEFLPKARTLNPDYSDDELTQAWQEKYGARGAKENDPGFGGTFLEGAKSTGRSLKAAAQTATGNLSGVEETANVEAEKDPALQKLLADIQVRKNALGKDPSWWQSLKAVGGAVADNPKGAAMLAVEQLPNSAVALGSAGAGALAGSALGPAGTIAGGIAGLFIGNTAIETGAKALEKAGDGFTPEERTETLKEGAIKGGVVTGFDAATFGLTKWLTGTVARAMERATINVLQREGIDTTNKAAVQAARQNPELVAKVQQAQETARAATNTLGKKLARGAGEVGSEAIGEGAGEYIGEVAATGKGDKVEAVIEALSGLGQSGAEIAVAQGMSRKQQQQGAFGDVTGQPIVTERTPEDMGLGRATDQPPPGPLALEGPPQPGELRKGTVYAPGEVLDVSPLPDVSPVLNAGSLDDAIANAVGVVRGATDTAKARAAEFTRMTAKAKNETDALLANAPEKRSGSEVPIITGQSEPLSETAEIIPKIIPGQAFTPRPEPIDDPRARLAEERARLVAQRDQQRLTQDNPVSEPVAPVPAVEQADTPLPSQVDLAYPSSKQVRDLIHEKGLHLDTPVFREYLKMAVGKEKFSDLTPRELQTLAEKVQKIKAPQQPTPTQEAPPQVPLTPTEPKERAYAPVTTIPEAQVPRSELTPEKNAEMLLRAEKAKVDMEIAGTERGGRFFQEQPGTGSTQEVTGLKSATADWYKDLTSGPSPAIRGDRKQSAREKIEVAIAKIINDQGADRGKAVEQVKAALLADTEFHKTEWGRDLNSIMQGEWPSWIEKPQGVTQATENAEEFQNVPRATPQAELEVSKPQANEFDADAFDRREQGINEQIAQSKYAGNKHLDQLPQYVENMRGVRIKSIRDGSTGVVTAVTNQGDVNVQWDDKASAESNLASEERTKAGVEYHSRLTARDLPEFIVQPGGKVFVSQGHVIRSKSSDKKVPLSRTERLAQQKQKMEEKKPLRGSDNSVRDHSQRASIAGDTITITSYVGNRKAGSITIPLDEWTRTEKGPSANPNWNRHVLMKKYASFLDDQSGGPHQAQRIRDSMERAIQKALATSTKPEPSPSNAPAMESRPTTASPEREPAPPAQEAAPTTAEVKERKAPISVTSEEPFSLSSPEVSKQKAKDQGLEQLSIDVPPPTSGERPIIGREATLEEAPLFSKNAQTPDAEQTSLSEPIENPDNTSVIPKQDSGSSAQSIAPDITPAQSETAQSAESAQSSTEIIADALRTAADKISGKQVPADEGPLPKQSQRKANEKIKRDGGLLNVNPARPQFDERNTERAEPTMAKFAQAFAEGAPIAGTAQKVIDSSQEFPKEMIEALSAKRYVRQLTEELGKVFNSMKRVLVQSDPETFSSVTFAALSPDSYYYGVNLRGPDQMILNPWTALHQVQQGVQEGFIGEEEVPEYLAGNLIKTLVHEFTHQQVTTTHQDERQPYFLAAEQRNRAILGSRLGMMQRQLMAVLTGGTNGTVEGIRADLKQQQAFWKEGDGLSAMDQSVSPKPTYARRRQGVSGEGASGRTGPPTYLRGGGESETLPLGESAGLRRSGAVTDSPAFKQEEYVAFDQGQIKSAIGNRGTFDPKDARIQFSRREKETGTIDPTETRDRLAAVKTSVRPYLLGALGLEQLSQVYGNDHAEVKAYNQATQAMEADFTEMSRESDKVARAWTDLKIPVADKMAQVMEDARFLNFDPDPRKNQEADSAKKQALVTRFQQLPDDAKAVYRMARDYYTNMAEQRFQALKERIERAGGTPENTRKLVDRLQLAYEKVRSKVYFPFSRFGENIVIAKQMKEGKEVDREVHAFESVAEAQKFATMMKLKGWQVKQTVAREYSVNKEGPASKIVRQMHDIIKELGQGQQGLPEVLNLEDQLLDSLNQSFLQALPDMSYAKHFIHAKDVKGASKDALRAFAHSALHGAHHISRIRHADKVTNALMDLDNSINATVEGDTTEARQVYNELVRRHNDIMNPTTHPFSAWLGQLGFTMSLGGVVATGITNATQVPLVTYPWMGARYGFGKASAALARAYRDFLDPRTLNKDSLFDATKSKLISESERKMLLELARRGHIDLTQTMDLAGLSSRDNLSRKARTLGTVGEKVTRMLGFTFHVPEVMNRQVTALSTFRLEKEKGGSFEEALERAQQAIQDTHFIYQCVDTETECMTPTGWKRYDELEVGQTIYGTDESGALIETTIEAVNIHRGEHKVLSMANQDGFTMVVTENHRCVTQLRDSRLKKWLKPRLTEARDLQYFHTLLRSPIGVHLQREAVYEDDFVALLAWVVAEGSYRKTNKSTVTISQSIAHNPARVAEIEDLLKRLGGHYRRYDVFDKRRPDYHGINFVLRRPLSYAVREALPDKMITPELMAKLTVDQMRLFVETFGKGDGYRISGLRITQKDRGTLDMLQVMATITGNTSYISQVKHGRHVWHVLYICSTTKRSYVKCLKPERVVVDTVWCPTTTCGTWIARRGGRTFVTGNSHNRPRYMQGNFLRVLTQFKQYSQNIAYTYGRAASIWLDRNNATKEERTVAKRQLLSMLALQFGAAGALGMPFFGAPLDLLMAVVSAMGDDDDEKRDWEVSLRKWLDGTATSLAEAFIDDKEQAGKAGKELAEVVAHGASRLTPWDMAGRLGQNDLFFREPQREREGRQAVMDWMLSLGGPVPGYGVNFLLGLGDVAKGMTELNAGFFMRGVEELTPAVLRNGVKSLRYTLEGVRTRDEYKQLDLDTSEKLGQLFGFTPARVAEMYESTTAVKNKEHRILNEQKALKDRFARAVDDQDDKAKQRILEDIRGFNERNPMFGITSDTLNQSLKARRQHEAGMERGLYLPPRRRALLEEGDWADF